MINFIHIPKNGGSSIEELCGKLCAENVESVLKYNDHSTDVHESSVQNQCIVIRNPIERFISAVQYAKIVYEIRIFDHPDDDTADNWIKAWSDKRHPNHRRLMEEMKNKEHKIGEKLLQFKYTYTPQSCWIDDPRYVILMDNFEEEMEYLFKKFSIEEKLPHVNTTHKCGGDYELSDRSIEFLQEFYKEDFERYEYYRKKTREQRIP